MPRQLALPPPVASIVQIEPFGQLPVRRSERMKTIRPLSPGKAPAAGPGGVRVEDDPHKVDDRVDGLRTVLDAWADLPGCGRSRCVGRHGPTNVKV